MQQNAPICQSCGMPMDKQEHFGTNKDDSKNKEYCTFCFQKGNFTEPNIKMEQMIKKVSDYLEQMKMLNAKETAKTSIPKLKRWKK